MNISGITGGLVKPLDAAGELARHAVVRDALDRLATKCVPIAENELGLSPTFLRELVEQGTPLGTEARAILDASPELRSHPLPNPTFQIPLLVKGRGHMVTLVNDMRRTVHFLDLHLNHATHEVTLDAAMPSIQASIAREAAELVSAGKAAPGGDDTRRATLLLAQQLANDSTMIWNRYVSGAKETPAKGLFGRFRDPTPAMPVSDQIALQHEAVLNARLAERLIDSVDPAILRPAGIAEKQVANSMWLRRNYFEASLADVYQSDKILHPNPDFHVMLSHAMEA